MDDATQRINSKLNNNMTGAERKLLLMLKQKQSRQKTLKTENIL
jgi:hypothetical protein